MTNELGESVSGPRALPAWLLYGLLPLVARLLLSAEFVIAALGKARGWSGQEDYMASHGMTMVAPLLGAALVIEAVGTTCLVMRSSWSNLPETNRPFSRTIGLCTSFTSEVLPIPEYPATSSRAARPPQVRSKAESSRLISASRP